MAKHWTSGINRGEQVNTHKTQHRTPLMASGKKQLMKKMIRESPSHFHSQLCHINPPGPGLDVFTPLPPSFSAWDYGSPIRGLIAEALLSGNFIQGRLLFFSQISKHGNILLSWFPKNALWFYSNSVDVKELNNKTKLYTSGQSTQIAFPSPTNQSSKSNF